MYKFQVFYCRNVNPDDGQWMLDKMVEQFGLQGPSDLKIAMPGITVHENPFPVWLQQWFTWAGLYYDDWNHCYAADNLTRPQAEQWNTFVETYLRGPYGMREDVQRVHTRRMQVAPEVEQLETF